MHVSSNLTGGKTEEIFPVKFDFFNTSRNFGSYEIEKTDEIGLKIKIGYSDSRTACNELKAFTRNLKIMIQLFLNKGLKFWSHLVSKTVHENFHRQTTFQWVGVNPNQDSSRHPKKKNLYKMGNRVWYS